MNEIKLIEKDGKHLCPRYDGRVHIGTSPPECAHDACGTLCACHYRVRVPELEAALAAAQEEVERLREVELMLRAGQLHYKKRGDARVELIQELGARAESAEAALEEARAGIERWRKDVMAVLDALCMPGHVADDEWADLCLLAGRYTEPFLSGFPGGRETMSDIKYRVLPDCDLMQIYDGFDVGAMGLRLAPDTAHLFASAPEMKERIAELEAIVERVEIECDLWPDCSPLAQRVRALLDGSGEGERERE